MFSQAPPRRTRIAVSSLKTPPLLTFSFQMSISVTVTSGVLLRPSEIIRAIATVSAWFGAGASGLS